MIRYFVYDAEYDRDAAGHATYQAAERFDPDGIERLRDKDPRIEPRWVFKRPVAISWLVLKEEDGKLSPEQFRSIGSPEMSEAELLGAFFSALNELPSNVPVVTWGGSSSDEPQIRLAALRLGLALPNRFQVPFLPGKRHGHGHVDLMTHMCGDAARVHLAEICASLRIPAKIVAAPTDTAGLISRGRWSQVKAVCEGDTLSTAALLIHAASGQGASGNLFGPLLAIARLGAKQTHRPYAEAFDAWANELVRLKSAQLISDLVACGDMNA